MNSKDLIIQKLKQLVAQFAAIRVRYQFDGDHIVEISPASMLKDNKVFQLAIHDIFLDFEDQYMEELMFVTDDDLVGVEKIDYEKEGSEFGLLPDTALHLEKGNLKFHIKFYQYIKSGSVYMNTEPSEMPGKEEEIISSSGEPNYAIAA